MSKNYTRIVLGLAAVVAIVVLLARIWPRTRFDLPPKIDMEASMHQQPVSDISRAPTPPAPPGLDAAQDHRQPPGAIDRRLRRTPPGYEPTEPNRDRPPFLDEDGTPTRPDPNDSAIRAMSREIATASGPEARDHADTLLASDQKGVGIVGAALYLNEPNWNEAAMQVIAEHADPDVPLFALQGLLDAGRTEEADQLLARLQDRWADVEDWSRLPGIGQFPGSALRGLVEIAANTLENEPQALLFDAIAANDSADYGARMRALLAFRDIESFEEYRNRVRVARAAAEQADAAPLWREGLERLAQRLDGPAAAHHGPQVMTPDDVDLMVAREYPAMYEDLALRLETAVRTENSLFGTGLARRLTDAAQTARQTPLSDSEAQALLRIETLAGQITESDVAGLVPPPPPHTQGQ